MRGWAGGYHNTQEVIYNKHHLFNSIFLYCSNKYQHNLQSVIVNWYPHSKWTPIFHSLGGLSAYFLQTPTQNSRQTNRTSICDPTHPTSIRVFPKLLHICSVFTLMVFFMTLEHFLFISFQSSWPAFNELNPFVSIFENHPFSAICTESSTNLSIYGFEMAVYWQLLAGVRVAVWLIPE